MIIRIILLFFLILHGTSLFSQVTIGNSEAPEKGALLQLKNINGVTNGDANANKGLALPRVYLKTAKSLIDLGITDPTYPKPEYSGMTVYNAADEYSYCVNLYAGIHVWQEDKWTPILDRAVLDSSAVSIYTDLRDPTNPEEYKYRSFGKAGIWMIENMRAMVTPNGIPLNSNMNAENGGWLFAIPSYVVPQVVNKLPDLPEPDPKKVPTWRKEMGLLYNWAAATVTRAGNLGAGGTDGKGQNINEQGTGEGTQKQGICPPGWHLPSDKEWTLLENEIIRNTSLYTYTQKNISQTDTITVIDPMPIQDLKEENRGKYGRAMLDYCLKAYKKPVIGQSKKASHGGFAIVPTGFYTTYGGLTSSETSYLSTSSQSRRGSIWYRAVNTVMYAKYQLGADNTHMFFSVRCKKD